MKFQVRVKPGSSRNLVEASEIGLDVWLRAQPENGKANAALICVLADHFGVSKNKVRIISGQSSRRKSVEIEDLGGPEGT